MPESGFSFFLWMTVGFTFLYVLVLSALATQPKNNPVIVTTVRDIHRRKRKRAVLVADALSMERLSAADQTADISEECCDS